MTTQDFESIRVDFWLDDKTLYAMEYTRYVPQKGDEVRFKGVVYKITYRIFIYDEKYPRIAVNMKMVPRVVWTKVKT